MKKTHMAIALAAALFATSQAKALVDVEVFGGYSQFTMGQVNKALDEGAKNFKNMGWTTVTVTPLNSGFNVGAEAGITVLPFLKIGPRLEYHQFFESGVKASGGNPVSLESKNSGNLMNMMLGLAFDTSLPLTGIIIKGGIYGGYGLSAIQMSAKASDNSVNDTLNASGGNFSGLINAEIRKKIIPFFSIGLNAGYRFLQIGEMKADKTSSVFGSTKDKALVDGTGANPLMFDMNGFQGGLELAFNF